MYGKNLVLKTCSTKGEKTFSISALALVESGEKVALENLWFKVTLHERLGIEFTHLEPEKPQPETFTLK